MITISPLTTGLPHGRYILCSVHSLFSTQLYPFPDESIVSYIITLRDILEALLGTINDTQKEPEIIQRSNNDGWLVDGQCSFYDFLSYFEKEDLYVKCNYHTVGGLLLEQLGHIPQSGEQVGWNNFRFEIVDMDGARIDKILVQVSNDNNI